MMTATWYMRLKPGGIFLLFVLLTSCLTNRFSGEDFAGAVANGDLAHESYTRSLRFVNAWMDYRDPVSGLIPTNLSGKKDIWEPFNAAADNYAFMVLTAWLLDRELYEGAMAEILRAERKLTSRIGSLPDAYRFSTRDFVTPEPDTTWIVFHASEYIKDGLIPLNEYMGPSPWTNRMMEMLDDLEKHYSVLKDLFQMGTYRAVSEEINGSMLQALSRVYWMTGEEKYLDWAIRIGDYYLSGERDLTALPYLRLRDHGCEILGGLSELYVTLHFARPELKLQYQEAMYKVLDRVLETGRNEDGLFYNAINPSTGEVVDSNIADTWGYTFNAYYSVFLTDHKTEYREAVLKGVSHLNEKYRNFAWEGKSHDGYADAIESGINIYNREPLPELKKWIDSEMKVMLDMQQESGIIGGGHPDGNFARTAIMYALWKTNGLHLSPWNKNLKAGSEVKDGKLFISLSSSVPWTGKLWFDYERHREILNLPLDYPRINQFPEWYTIDTRGNYTLFDLHRKTKKRISGYILREGLDISLNPGDTTLLILTKK